MGSGLLDLVNSTDLLRHGILAVLSLNIGKGITSVGASIASTVKQMNTLGNALQQIKNLPVDDTRDDVLEDIGKATKNLTEKNLKLLLSKKQLIDSDKETILKAHELSNEEAKAKLEKMGLLTVTKQQTTANIAEAATTGTLRNAMLSLKASVIGVGTSIKAAFLSNPIGIILMGITTAVSIGTTLINNHNKKLEETRQAMQDAKQEYQDLTSEVADLNEELETTQKRLEELEEYDRLKAANDELEREYRIKEALAKVKAKEVADNAKKSLDSESEWSIENYIYGARRERVDKIESINEYLNLAEKQRQSLEETKQALEDYENTYSGTAKEMVQDKSWQKLNDNVEKAEDMLSDTEKIISEKYESIEEEAEGLVDSFGNAVSGCEEMYKRVEDLKNRTDEYFSLATGISDETKTLGSAEMPKINTQTLFEQLTVGKESLDTFQASVKSATDAYSTLLSGNYSSTELLDCIQEINQAMSDMGGSLNWEFINSQADSLELLGDAIQHVSQKYAESILSDAGIDIDSEFGQMLANIIQQIYDAEAAFEGMNSQLDNLQSSYQTLTGILESYNETGYISLDNLQSLLTADENLIQMLQVENGQLVLNQQAYENLVAVQLLEFKAKLNDAAAAEIETLAKQKAEQATNQNADASQNAVAKLDAETQAFNRNTSAAIANAVAKAEESGVSEAEIQGVFDKYTEVWDSAMSNYNIDFDSFMGGGKSAAGKAGGEHADAYLEAFEEEYSHLKDMLDRGELSEAQYLSRLRALYTKYFKDRKKYLDEFKKYESEYLSGMLDLHNKALSGISTLLNRRISAANDAKSASIDAINEEKSAKLDALNEEKENVIDTLEAEKQARVDALETAKKQYEEQAELIDKQIAAKNKIIDGINDEIDAMKSANEQRKMAVNLQQDEYNLQRLLNQKSKLVYTEDGYKYDIDSSGAREAKQKVEDDKLEIAISNKEKQIKLIEKEIDLLNDKKDAINEQIDLLSDEISKVNEYYDSLIDEKQKYYDDMINDTEKYYDNLVKQQEKYWDAMIKGMEQTKSRYEELAEVEEIAKAFSYIQQVFGDLGYTVEDVLNGSDAAFEDFKARYISVINDMNSNSDFTDGLVYSTGIAKENLGSFLDKTKETAEGLDELGGKSSEMDKLSDSATTASASTGEIASSMGELNTSTEGLSDNLNGINDALASIPEADKFNNLATSFTNLGDAIKGVADALGVGGEGTVGGLASALNEISTLSLDGMGGGEEGSGNSGGGIISQFQILKTAVEDVANAISGGGGSSGGKGGDASSSSSASMSSGAGGEGAGSLVGAIEQFKTSADEALGGGGEEGEGSEGGGTGAIPQFKDLETAVGEVTAAIGGGESEGESSGEGESDNLIGSIVDLGETSEETLGEPDGDGVIGRFKEFESAIEEAANQVRSISEGLEAIDGQEVECTITVNVKMNGSIPAFASGTVLENMQIESATYNEKYGKAFASGAIGLPHAEKNALVSEYGQTEMTVLPDGRTIVTDTPTMMDLPKDTVTYNEEETKKIMDNKIDISGNAHADGTVGNSSVPGTQVLADDIAKMPLWERMEKCAAALGRTMDDMLNPLNSIALDIRKETGVGRLLESVNNVNNVTNNT